MPRFNFTLSWVVVALLMHGTAAADTDSGLAAYKNGDFATAIDELRGPAERGDVRAQWLLGSAFSNSARPGKPSPEQWHEAMMWLRSAADQGHVRAMLDVANLYMFYQDPKDVPAAVPWFLKAAQHGHPEAQFMMGIMHFSGDGVPKDYVEAYKWWLLSARNGHPLARQMLQKSLDVITEEQTIEARQQASRWTPVE